MPNWSYQEFAPYKVVRCRFFDNRGRAIRPYCPDGGFCRFLHPHDKGWPGLDPKPSFRLDESPSFASSPVSRKRARSPFDSPRRSISPQRYRGRLERCYSPEMEFVQTYDEHRYSPISRYNSHREPSPVYRREREPSPPRLKYGKKRAYSGPNITGSNSISLKSPRSLRPRLSVDTSRISSSPEPRTPTHYNNRNSKISQSNNRHDLGDPRNDRLKPSVSEDARDSPFVERDNQSKQILDPISDFSAGKPKPPSESVAPDGKPAAVTRTRVRVPTSPKGPAYVAPVPTGPKYIPSSPKGPIAKDGSSNIMRLINQLTRVHLRLLDNRKTHEDESLKLQAFESLAAKFDIPVALTTTPSSKLPISNPVSTFGPFGSALNTSARYSTAFGATLPVEGSNNSSKVALRVTSVNSRKQTHGRSSSLPISTTQNIGRELPQTLDLSYNSPAVGREFLYTQAQRDTASLASRIEHNFGDSITPQQPTDESGHQIAHRALLETLDGIRERQAKVGKRVRDDFEEMAKVLETIWMGTFDVRTTFQGGTKQASNTKISPTSGTEGASSTGGQRCSVATTTAATTAAASFSIEKSSGSAGNGLVTASDNSGKVLKKMRRVSFDDEVGASEQEKELLRRMEEKIAGMERKLTKLVLVEKENVKMKAELKNQKEALETINNSLEDQAKILDELVESSRSWTSPSRPEADSDGTSQDGAPKSTP